MTQILLFLASNFFMVFSLESENNIGIETFAKTFLYIFISCAILARARFNLYIQGVLKKSKHNFFWNNIFTPASSSIVVVAFAHPDQYLDYWWVVILSILVSFDPKNSIPLMVWNNRNTLIKKYEFIDSIEKLNPKDVELSSLIINATLITPVCYSLIECLR